MKKFIKGLLFFFIFLLILSLFLFDTYDSPDYRKTNYYLETIEGIRNEPSDTTTPTNFEVGWAKGNITPSSPKHLAGYGWLRGKHEQVRDSVFVRSIVLSQNRKTFAIISYDLLIVSPTIVKELNKLKADLGIDEFYFSSTHTHSSFGGWDNSILGSLSIGFYDQEIVDSLINKTVESIKNAKKNISQGTYSYHELDAKEHITNKIPNHHYVDDKLRFVEFKNKTETCALVSFAAHAIFTPLTSLKLSNDYPGFLIERLESSSQYDFAVFCAGTVGLHKGNYNFITNDYEGVKKYGYSLADKILQKNILETHKSAAISFKKYTISLPQPTFKISQCIRLRPFIFNKMSSRNNISYLSKLNLGKVRLIGMPADFSGELSENIISDSNDVIITSFNGDYIGYIIPDRYYYNEIREAKESNWYGKQTGSYFTEITNEILKKQ